MRPSIILLLLACAEGVAQAQPRVATPPATRMVQQVDDFHGVKVADPYRWLEDEQDAEVLSWVDAQNARTRSYLDQFADRSAIKAKIEELYAPPVTTAPRVVGNRYFFWRRIGTLNHSILYVRRGSHTGRPKKLLDPNELSADGTVAVDWTSISPDGNLLAYGTSASGDEKSTMQILDVRTLEHLGDVIPQTRYASVAWAKDGKSFFYTRYPAPGTVPAGQENYHRKTYHHQLGDDWHSDPVVVADLVTKEEFVNPYANATHDWLFLSRSVDWTRNDLYIRPLQDGGGFRPVAVGLDGRFSAELVYGKLFILTDYQSPRYRIMTADPERPTPAQWKELIPETDAVIVSFKVIDQRLILHVRQSAHSCLFIYGLDGRRLSEIELPTLGTVSGLSGEWNRSELFFSFQSFVHPPAVFHYDLRSGELERIDEKGIVVDADQFVTRQIWATSKDGTRFPMFVVHKKGIELDGDNPTVLHGYGGFNISVTPSFKRDRFVWLDRGAVYASANLRGGGEFGSEWHRAGRLGNKQNVFDDFIAAAETLIEQKYTNPQKLAISGRSNGGLLVGACLVQRPDLFRAVVCTVPLLDMLRYHKFSIARLWIPEYGSADDAEQFKWLRAYSPYHNVDDGTAYPSVLLQTAASDSRVASLHAWKMAARLQSATGSNRPILLRTESKAGHGAGKPLWKKIEAMSDEWTFLMAELGMITASPATNGESDDPS